MTTVAADSTTTPAGPGRTVALVTLGCARNEVDSEELAGRLAADGWSLVADAADADAVLVNTCGFIEAAKKDSVDTLLAVADGKGEGRTKAVVAVGCMAERYGTELAAALPEADAILGFDAYAGISQTLQRILDGDRPASHTPTDRRTLLPISPVERKHATVSIPGHADVPIGEVPGTPASGPRAILRHRLDTSVVASLKLASGCDRRCAFCAIPAFRGSFVSRDPQDLLAEAEWLASTGVRELVLVSENSTSYGKDLGDVRMLEKLLPELAAIDGIVRVRPVYLQPAEMRPSLVEALTGTPGVAAYADLSFQHASGPLLRRMRRFGDSESFLTLLQQLRDRAPELGARSNVIVGFPGETEADVRILEEFLEAARLDAVGVFGYSDEEGTEAAGLTPKVKQREVDRRVRRLRDLTEQLVDERAAERIDSEVDILVESIAGGVAEGRAHHQQPEVDGSCQLYPRGLELRVGDLVRGRVTANEGVDLLVDALSVLSRATRGPLGAALGGQAVPVGGAVDAATDGHPSGAETSRSQSTRAVHIRSAHETTVGRPDRTAVTGAAVNGPAAEQPGRPAEKPAEPPLLTALDQSPAVAHVKAALHRPEDVPLVNIANVLTTLRLLFVPVFLVLLFADGGHADGWRVAAWAVFAAAAITDRFDGQIARNRGLVTSFGTLADPIADKALVGAGLIGLNCLGDLPVWVTVVILFRELGVTLLRLMVARHKVIGASRGGKLKALVQVTAVGLYVLPRPSWLDVPLAAYMGLAIVLTVVTGLDYVVKVREVRRGIKRD